MSTGDFDDARQKDVDGVLDMMGQYPEFSPLRLEQRVILHRRFHGLAEGISELTFASIYLFRHRRHYQIAKAEGDTVIVIGADEEPFFILPFGWPSRELLDSLFDRYSVMKAVSVAQAEQLSRMGYRVWEDRDNFDYLYRRDELATLAGRKLHRKKNLVNVFLRNNECVARPLLEEYVDDALRILDRWREQQDAPGDYEAAREALENTEVLQLCGGIFTIDDEPVAYTLGEELARGTMFVVHFEKAVLREEHRGLYQYVNRAFAAVLPDKYELINREQDLGDPGLRQAKDSYRPVGFVRKYRAARRST